MDTTIAAISIGGRKVGPGQPCFVIAEAGVNHNGDVETARKLVDAAVDSGADAVKFQTFKAERLAIPEAPKAAYQNRTTGTEESQLQMLRRLELSYEDHALLMTQCDDKGILFMSSPFDEESADMLAELGVAVFKVPSGELNNLSFLAHVARKGKPMIISTGMSYLSEVEKAVLTVREAGNSDFALLQCVSNYPADPSDANLAAMRTMSAAFHAPVGYSDHTLGIEVPLAAVALGACIVEKHLTLDRGLAGPDHQSSLEPAEFVAMVQGIRVVQTALGHGRKEPAASEANTAAAARKSLVASCDIPPGATLTKDHIVTKRPGTGLPPSMGCYLVGRTARVLIPAGALLDLEMLA